MCWETYAICEARHRGAADFLCVDTDGTYVGTVSFAGMVRGVGVVRWKVVT